MAFGIVLVYHNESMGYTSIDGKRVYGKYFSYGSFGPTEMTYGQFRKYKKILCEAPITEKWLAKKFNREFPQCSFIYSKMRDLDFVTLIEIAKLLGVDYRKPRYPTKKDRMALKRTVIKIIDSSI